MVKVERIRFGLYVHDGREVKMAVCYTVSQLVCYIVSTIRKQGEMNTAAHPASSFKNTLFENLTHVYKVF